MSQADSGTGRHKFDFVTMFFVAYFQGILLLFHISVH